MREEVPLVTLTLPKSVPRGSLMVIWPLVKAVFFPPVTRIATLLPVPKPVTWKE